jgi:hypothetical protein
MANFSDDDFLCVLWLLVAILATGSLWNVSPLSVFIIWLLVWDELKKS